MIAAAPIDYRELARRRLPPFLFENLDGGSYAEVTLRRNIADLEAVALRQRVLCNVDLPVPGARYRDLRSGLAGGGEVGVSHMLGLIAAEIRVAMALTGATRIDQIDRDILVGTMERNNFYGR